MGAKKKYLTKSVNFGIVGSPSRIIAEELEKQLGTKGFSAYMRKILFLANHEKSDLKELYHKKGLIHDYDEVNKNIRDLAENKRKLIIELENIGIDPDSLI